MTHNENPARAQAAANTVKLIQWAAEAVTKPLPEPVRRRAAIILSDDIGAMVAGSLETQVARAREGLLRTSSGKRRSDGARARARRAPTATPRRARTAWRSPGASSTRASATPPAMAARIPSRRCWPKSEAQGRTVEEVLRALAIAYEVTTRFALAFPFPVFNVHPHAAFAAIGGAAAASLARRQDANTMLAAVTGGASMSFAGPFDTAVEGALHAVTPGPRPAPGSACAPRTGPRPESAATMSRPTMFSSAPTRRMQNQTPSSPAWATPGQ